MSATIDLSGLASTARTAKTAGGATTARAGLGAEVSAAVASLPRTLRAVDRSERADIVAVTGRDWARRAVSAAADDARAVLVVEPEPVAPEDLNALAAARAAVVIDSSWRHNPAVEGIAPPFAEYRQPGALVEARSLATPSADLGATALGLLDLVTALAGDLAELRVLVRDHRRLLLAGRFGDDSMLMLTILTTSGAPEGVTVRITGHDGAATISLPHPGTAAPASATVTTPRGHTMMPTSYESAHRVALRRVAAAATGSAASGPGTSEPDDLPRFRGYARQLAAAFAAGPHAQPAVSGHRAHYRP